MFDAPRNVRMEERSMLCKISRERSKIRVAAEAWPRR